MSKVSCPQCGNNTLMKIPVEINENGEIIHLQDQRKISTRGTIV